MVVGLGYEGSGKKEGIGGPCKEPENSGVPASLLLAAGGWGRCRVSRRTRSSADIGSYYRCYDLPGEVAGFIDGEWALCSHYVVLFHFSGFPTHCALLQSRLLGSLPWNSQYSAQ